MDAIVSVKAFLAKHEGVDILRPFLNLGHALQIEVVLVEARLIIHSLVAESELPHLVAAAA